MKVKQLTNKMSRVLNIIFLSLIGIPICAFTPVDNRKIVFSSFSGRGYTCNPKYILEEMLRRNVKADYVWLTTGYDKNIPKDVRQVRYGSISALHELASARIWVDNTRGEKCMIKKQSQFYLMTWHSSLGGLKKVERDIDKQMNPLYRVFARIDGLQTDLMISNNSFADSLYKRSFWYRGPVMRTSMPRNYPLFHNLDASKKKVFEHFGIPEDCKICLYAPTFRRRQKNDSIYVFDYKKCTDALSEKFGGKFVFMLRLHPNISREMNLSVSGNQIYDASNYSDIQELVASTDILISDYSTVSDDFTHLNRPGFLYVPDIDMYKNRDRGLYFPLDTLPFPIALDESELIDKILSFSYKVFMDKNALYHHFIGLEEDGSGAHEVVDLLEKVLDGEALEL